MLYDAYEISRGWLTGASAVARLGADWWANPANPLAHTGAGEMASAALDVFSHAAAPRGKPEFGFASTLIDGKVVPVSETIVDRKPFGQLKRFERTGASPLSISTRVWRQVSRTFNARDRALASMRWNVSINARSSKTFLAVLS